jgi:hypothetical protein
MADFKCPWCGHIGGKFWDSGWLRRPETPYAIVCAVVWSYDECHMMIRSIAANELKSDCPELRDVKEAQAKESIICYANDYCERGEKPPVPAMDFGDDDD